MWSTHLGMRSETVSSFSATAIRSRFLRQSGHSESFECTPKGRLDHELHIWEEAAKDQQEVVLVGLGVRYEESEVSPRLRESRRECFRFTESLL